MKNKKIIIIIVILLLVLLLVLLVFLLKGKKNPENTITEVPVDYYESYQQQRAEQGITASDATAHYEDNVNEYYTVEGIIKSFNTNASYLNSSARDLSLIVTKENEQKVLQEYRQKGYKYINNVLAKTYKTKYSVNNDYIYNSVKDNTGKKYTINDMYVVDDSDFINTYFVYGDFDGKDFNFIVILDRYNCTFEIYLDNYLVDNNIQKSNEKSMKTLNVEHVEKNESNSFQYKNITQEQMVKIYYNDYVDLMKKNINKAYEMVDGDYKQKRVDTIDKFKNHISARVSAVSDIVLDSYSVNKVGNHLELICCDNFGNYTIFKVTSVLKYTAILDSYTINIDQLTDEYNNAQDRNKAIICVNKFLECINNKDYDVAYRHLNSTFKDSKFKTLESFTEFVNSKWFDLNKYSFESVRVQDNDYIFKGKLFYTTEQGSYDSGVTENSFVVRLNTNSSDYEISFESK